MQTFVATKFLNLSERKSIELFQTGYECLKSTVQSKTFLNRNYESEIYDKKISTFDTKLINDRKIQDATIDPFWDTILD